MGMIVLLPPWNACVQRVPELINPHIRRPSAGSCRIPMSELSNSEAGLSFSNSYSWKARGSLKTILKNP